MLSLEGATYRHAGAIDDSLVDVSLEVPLGSITGLVGAADAGKSTLCLVLGGLAPRVIGGQLGGRLLVDGEDVAGWPMHRLAEVVVTGIQDPSGQLSMIADSVVEEVAFGPLNLGLERDEALDRVAEALDRLGITELGARDPSRLSGGQQQLVVLAGLIAMRPRYLVLDEPLAHLDARAVEVVVAALAESAREGTGILLAEQRTGPLAGCCERVLAVDAGRIVAQGSPSQVLASPVVVGLGVEEPPMLRLERLAREAGMDPSDAGRGA